MYQYTGTESRRAIVKDEYKQMGRERKDKRRQEGIRWRDEVEKAEPIKWSGPVGWVCAIGPWTEDHGQQRSSRCRSARVALFLAGKWRSAAD